MQPVHPMSDEELDAHIAELQAKASEKLKRFMQPPADRVAELRTDWRVTPRREKS